MNIEIKQENTGLFPTYLNLASSGTKFQIQDDTTARLSNFSSCNTLFIAEREPVPVKQYVIYR